MTAREFDLGDVISITTGRLVSPRLIDGVYDILNFMTGDDLYTHALPRACEAMRPVLLAQHPQLRDVEHSHVTTENWREWMDDLYARFGRSLMVAPCQPCDFQSMHPLSEPILDGKSVIVISTEGAK